MISVIITTFQEPKTLYKAIQAVLNQDFKHDDIEIIVVGPDKDTENITKEFSKNYQQIKHLKDKGKGKPAALNLAFKLARGDILILTDGDVWIEKDSIRDLLKPFKKNKHIGAVSGQPVSINSPGTLLGYWSHFLTHAAHKMRLNSETFPCSGYLYAIRNVIKQIPQDSLAEDGVITQMVRNKGFDVVYAPEAKVYVKYPDNFKDWFKQKIRSTGGYTQKQGRGDRSFKQEMKHGLILFFTYPGNLKEFFWTILLYLSRIYLWLMIFWKIKIKKKKFSKIWQRVESTK